MKKNIFLTVAAAVMLLFTSCSKDIDLNGTQWKANFSKTVTYEGVEASLNMNFNVQFTGETTYKMTESGTMTAFGQTFDMDAETTEGTYTFDGEDGKFDGETSFSYDKKNKSLVVELEIDDEETAEMFGSDKITLVFTQVK